MNVQDPPLVLNFKARSGDPVDKKKFSVYTKNGSVVDFVVWPAVMYENETLFRKGVLQAKWHRTIERTNEIFDMCLFVPYCDMSLEVKSQREVYGLNIFY